MAIVRWNPFRDMETVQEKFNRLLNESFFGPHEKEELFQGAWSPAADIYEDKEAIRINLEIPGIEKEAIDIQLHDNTLTIKGERKFAAEEKKENFHRIERGYGSFSRMFTLPDLVQKDKVSAAYKDGVLTITLPKIEAAKPTQIKIGVE